MSHAFTFADDSVKTREGFDAFYAKHRQSVSNAAYKVVGAHCVAEDIAQDVFVHAWRSFGDYDSTRGSVASYLRGIARNRAIDWLRSDSARVRRELRLAPDEYAARGCAHEEMHNRIDHRVVREKLARLPMHEREPIVLAYYAGMSYREVAVHLGWPEGTVKSRIRHGLQTLSDQLQPLR